MNEKKARKILGIFVEPNGGLRNLDQCLAWPTAGGDKKYAVLNAQFTANELEAIAWWMRNK